MFNKKGMAMKYLVALIIFVGLLIVLLGIMFVGKDALYKIARSFDVTTLKELFS